MGIDKQVKNKKFSSRTLFQLRAEKDYRLLFPSPDDLSFDFTAPCFLYHFKCAAQIYQIRKKYRFIYSYLYIVDYTYFDIFDIVFCYGYQLIDRIRALFNHHHFKVNIKQI